MPGLRQWLARLRGSSVDFDLRAYAAPLNEIARLEPELERFSPDQLRERARDGDRSVVFALVREAARRTLGLRPFDVQVVAALALDAGQIVEMQTGEGKTLAAVMPAALNAALGQRRPRADLQRLSRPPRRGVDAPDLRASGPARRVHPARHDAGGAPPRVPRRRHLPHRQGSRVRPSARLARDDRPRIWCIARFTSRSSTRPIRS